MQEHHTLRTDGLERYGHGGDLLTAAQAYGLPPHSFIDFSSNMNPWGPPPSVREQIAAFSEEIMHYPDPGMRELKQKLATRYGVSSSSLAVGNGAAELIDLTARAFLPGRKVVLIRPSFAEYEQAITRAGGEIIEVPLQAADQFRLHTDALFSAAEEADALFVGHPNNPTGQLFPREPLLQLADAGKRVIVDEAFVDFSPAEDEVSLLCEAAAHPNLIVLRSMTKFYAVPGIRLGFMVAHPERIREVEALQVTWSVNTLAQRIGVAVLDNHDFTENTKAWLAQERPWLTKRLMELGIGVAPSDSNYLLLTLPANWTARALQTELGRRGILVRDASLFPGLSASHCRVAVRRREHNLKLLSSLEQVLT